MKNKYSINGDVVTIYMRKRNGEILETQIDVEDLSRADEFTGTWYAHKNHDGKVYVRGNFPLGGKKQKMVIFHRWLFPTIKPSMVVDHIDHDTLNNRRITNLREVTTLENSQNRSGHNKNNKTSKVRGVCWNKEKRKWIVTVNLKGKKSHVGQFEMLEDAEIAAIERRKSVMPFSQEALQNMECLSL